jgi:dihydrofolate reductase
VAGKVVWHVTMSLDGFIAGRDDAMDWVFGFSGVSPMGRQVIDTTGAILTGRRLYDLGVGWDDAVKPYGGGWHGPVFVLTHRPPATSGASVTFLADGVERAIATGLQAARGRNLVLFGATIPSQALRLGLVDELVIHLAPILVGDGIRLFGGPDAPRVPLEKVEAADAGQVTDFRFRVLNGRRS